MLVPLLVWGGSLSVLASDPATKLEAILVWGTNDPAPDDPSLKPLDPRTARKLGKLPFKWKSYYEVKRVPFEVEPGKRKRVTLSEECQIVVRTVEGDTVELALHGKGKLVGKVTQSLPKGQDLVTGGDAENLSAWFVVLRRTE